jgi:hypothetical protein
VKFLKSQNSSLATFDIENVVTIILGELILRIVVIMVF